MVAAIIQVVARESLPAKYGEHRVHGIQFSDLDVAAIQVIAFTISLAAFLADILRGGIDAIPVGHVEAGRAVGFDGFTVLRRIVIPETIRRSLPAMSAM